MKKFTWSYSALQLFQQCPHKYYRLRVKKDVKDDVDSPHLRYGNEVHKAAELYMRDGKELPESMEFLRPYLDKFRDMPGKKYCELRMGITRDLEPCEFFARDVWLRAIADLIIIDGDTATLIDYKTGKSSRYADKDQLELLSLVVFKHFPRVKKIRGALLFVVCDEIVKAKYSGELNERWSSWIGETAKVQAAGKNNNWPKLPNFTCMNCPVVDCEHRRERY